MKKIDIAAITFPSIFMIIATIISFVEIPIISELDVKGFFVLSLVVIFPTLIFMQGIISGRYKINILLSLGMTLLTFVVIMIICLNTSALIYIGIYIICWLFGYLLSKLLFRKKDLQDGQGESTNLEE